SALAPAPRPSGLATDSPHRGRSARRPRASTDRRRRCRPRPSSSCESRARPDPCPAGSRSAAGGCNARHERSPERRRRRRSVVGRPAVRVRGCVHRHRPYHRSSGNRVTETTIPRGNTLPRIRPWLGIAAAAPVVVASVMPLAWPPTAPVQCGAYRLLPGLSSDFSCRATRAAVFGISAVVDVPIVHLSVLWANSLHQLPTVLRAAGSPALDSSMLLTLMVSLFAYTLIYAYFIS